MPRAAKEGKGPFAPSPSPVENGDSEESEYRGKSKQSKSSRDRVRDTIWTVPEPEKPKKSKQPTKKSKKPSKELTEQEEAENQLYESALQNWTLPRVELWCRDPKCKFNLELWGDHPEYHPHQINQHPQLRQNSPALHNSLPFGHNDWSQIPGGPPGTLDTHLIHKHQQPNIHTHYPTSKGSSKNSGPMMPSNKGSSHSVGGGSSGNMHMNMSLNLNSSNITSSSNKKEKEGPMMNTADSPHPHHISAADKIIGKTASTSDIITISNSGIPSKTTGDNTNTGSSINSTRSGATTELSSTSTTSTTTTGFESGSGSSNTKSESLTRSERLSMIYAPGNTYASLPYVQQNATNPFCPSCNGVVPLNHLEPIQEVAPLKAENGFWNFNQFNHPHPLQRDHSFHSFGGFTLNGQYNTQVKKHKMVKFCSSHKIALVVSTFSLIVTIGLVITLLLMKKKGMMET